MTISEYGSIFSIVIFGYLLFPGVVLGCLGRSIKYYAILISLPILYLLMGKTKSEYFIVFLVFEYLLILVYQYIKKKSDNEKFYYLIIFLSFIPIVYAKLAPAVHWHIYEVLGISYMCFRIWQTMIEIHDGHITELKKLDLLYFITFFPTISSGPIDRYNRFIEDANKKLASSEYINNYLCKGLHKIFWGLVYKFGIANLINLYILSKIPEQITFLRAVKYMYTYTFYLFFDFAGYSLLAIGTGYLLGIMVPENFNKPFLAKNMKDFWERWHISLSKWFGDYLFSRFVLNALRNKWVVKQSTATRLGYMFSMTVMGIWHGVTLYYVLYGIYQGLALMLTDIYLKSKTYRKQMKQKHYTLISRIVCFHIVAFGLLLFSGYLIKI